MENSEDRYSRRLEESRQAVMLGVEAIEKGEFIEREVLFHRLREKLES